MDACLHLWCSSRIRSLASDPVTTTCLSTIATPVTSSVFAILYGNVNRMATMQKHRRLKSRSTVTHLCPQIHSRLQRSKIKLLKQIVSANAGAQKIFQLPQRFRTAQKPTAPGTPVLCQDPLNAIMGPQPRPGFLRATPITHWRSDVGLAENGRFHAHCLGFGTCPASRAPAPPSPATFIITIARRVPLA